MYTAKGKRISLFGPIVQRPRTLVFHAKNAGSNPAGIIPDEVCLPIGVCELKNTDCT